MRGSLQRGRVMVLSLGLFACGAPAPTAEDEPGDSEGDTGDGADEGPVIVCMPGETRCGDPHRLEICAPTGLVWSSELCGTHESCVPCEAGDEEGDEAEGCEATCVGPCAVPDALPSSAGCSFFAPTMLHFALLENDAVGDAMVVGNPNEAGVATVQLHFTPEGSNIEEPVGEPVALAPGQTEVFEFDAGLNAYSSNDPETSMFRSGGVHHVTSDLPVIAYLHAPYERAFTNESTLLLPERSLRRDHVIYGYTPRATPSYFVVIAVEDHTTVRWRPAVETSGDFLPLPFVDAGQQGEQLLNRFDNIRVVASASLGRPHCGQDLSGTLVTADKPIWVLSEIVGAIVPYCATFVTESTAPCVPPLGPHPLHEDCYGSINAIQEQNIPIDYWGQTYVGAHAPVRANEDHYWRLFAGGDGLTITTDPPLPGTPIQLAARGDWAELVVPSQTNVVFEGDGPFMPIQYTASHYMAGGIGNPSMTQTIPVEQFLSRYVFVTGYDYPRHYVQIVRSAGGAPVLFDDDQIVSDYVTVGDYEVANMAIAEGAHEISSDDPFGIAQYGYTEEHLPDDYGTAYAYPGGMKVEPLFVP